MKIKKVLVSVSLALASGVLFAGQSTDIPVEIDLVAMSAAGNMKTARFSQNEDAQIGCGTRTYSDGLGNQYIWGFCQAATDNVEENRAFCFTEDTVLLDEINSTSESAYVSFRWNEEGNCTYVGNSTQSQYISSNKDEEKKVKKDSKSRE